MKLHFSGLRPGDEPITSVAEYYAARQPYTELWLQLDVIQLEMNKQHDQGKVIDQKLLDESDTVLSQMRQARSRFFHRQPHVLISRCPYCAREIWSRVGVFSLMDKFWYRLDNRGDVANESLCKHLFCVDGALNLRGHQPADARPSPMALHKTIHMAAGVPFVKPRVLNLPTMVVVIHGFPVADRYVAFPIVYFAEQQPPQLEYCIGWARQEYVAGREGFPQDTMTGKRVDAQDYDLVKWVEQGKLFWLNPAGDEHPLVRGPAEAFPYGNVQGRRHPYTITDGQVSDLPNPTRDEEPDWYTEWMGP